MYINADHIIYTPARRAIDYNFLLTAKETLSSDDFDLLSSMVEE
jgi:hypothetical protein